jgi:hypothetical protein
MTSTNDDDGDEVAPGADISTAELTVASFHPYARQFSPGQIKRHDARLVHLPNLKSKSATRNQFFRLDPTPYRLAQFVIHIKPRKAALFCDRVYAKFYHPPELDEPYTHVGINAFAVVDDTTDGDKPMSLSVVVHLNPLYDRVYNGVDIYCHYMRVLRRHHYKIIGTEHSVTPISEMSNKVVFSLHRSCPSLRKWLGNPAHLCDRSLSLGSGEITHKKLKRSLELGMKRME